jgi:hypothetical protein
MEMVTGPNGRRFELVGHHRSFFSCFVFFFVLFVPLW